MTSLQIPLPHSYQHSFQQVPSGQFGREPAVHPGNAPESALPPEVLMVSADTELCSKASELLTRHGFCVRSVQNGTQGLSECLNASHGLVIVDAELPVLDGLALVQELRTRSTVPVLLIASSEEQCMGAIEAGADDFVLKPVGLAELLARSHGVLLRSAKLSVSQSTVLRCNEISVNVRTHEAFVGDQTLSLTNIEFAILKCLIRCAGKIVSRDELAAVLYQRKSTPFERSIDVHISHLRKKIELMGKCGIRTIRGVGYLLASAA